MSDILVAADETAATKIVNAATGAIPPPSASGTNTLGPFGVTWSASASFSGGSVDLIAPDIVRIVGMTMAFSVNFTFLIDLGRILPEFCLPRICVRIPFIGRVCTPRICIDWPTIPIPLSHSGAVNFTADFRPVIFLDGTEWVIEIEVLGTPFLQLDPISTAILVALGLAAAAALAPIPFIGPFLAIAVAAIVAAIGVAALTGLLGLILTPFVSGLRFEIYRQDRLYQLPIPTGPLDPAVVVIIDALAAEVRSSDEDELVVTADISA